MVVSHIDFVIAPLYLSLFTYMLSVQILIQDATLLPKWKAFRTVIFLEQVRCITNEWYLTLQVVIGLVKHKV